MAQLRAIAQYAYKKTYAQHIPSDPRRRILTSTDREFLCAMQRAVPADDRETTVSWFNPYVASLMGKEPKLIRPIIAGETVCPVKKIL